jgi:hypothetical protein
MRSTRRIIVVASEDDRAPPPRSRADQYKLGSTEWCITTDHQFGRGPPLLPSCGSAGEPSDAMLTPACGRRRRRVHTHAHRTAPSALRGRFSAACRTEIGTACGGLGQGLAIDTSGGGGGLAHHHRHLAGSERASGASALCTAGRGQAPHRGRPPPPASSHRTHALTHRDGVDVEGDDGDGAAGHRHHHQLRELNGPARK